MHIRDGELKAFLDGELSIERRKRVDLHLYSCESCQESAKDIKIRSNRVSKILQPIQEIPARHELPARAAYQRLALIQASSKEKFPMFSRMKKILQTPAGISAVLVALLLVSLVFPTIRAAAVDFLGLFRIQQIEVVEFDPSALPSEMSNQFLELENVLAGQMKTTGGGEPIEAADAAEASQLAGYPVFLPDVGIVEQRLTVQPGRTAYFDIDLLLWQALLDEIGRSDIELPSSLDGETVTITMPEVVTLYAGSCASADDRPEKMPRQLENCTIFFQSLSPVVDAPADLPVDELGQAFLQLAGMSDTEAARFSARVDWYTTLILPVPQGSDYREVEINGAPGTLLQSTNSYDTTHYTLIWVDNGNLFSIIGSGSPDQAVTLAKSLR